MFLPALWVIGWIGLMSGACALEEGGFGGFGPDNSDSSPPLAGDADAADSPGQGGEQDGAPADAPIRDSTFTDATELPPCPGQTYRCGTQCVADCYKDCARNVVCEATKKCVPSCASCGTASKVCYKCPDSVNPFGSCEQPKGECYAGLYTPCSCSTNPQSPSGDPSKCPGEDMACIHLNEQNFVCKTCGDKETKDKACGKTAGRKCEVEENVGSCVKDD